MDSSEFHISHRYLNNLLQPSSVAVIGASPRPEALGSRVLRNLTISGFRGNVYAVHPRAETIQGFTCVPDIDALPRVPDCIAVGVSADKVLPTLENAAARGVNAAVVFASGFAEAGRSGRALQESLVDFCMRSGMAVCGPNVLGVRSVHHDYALYSAPLPQTSMGGGVAVAAHSGSACIALSSTGRFGLSYVISVGNAASLDMDDYLDFFAQDCHTRMACLFLEDVRRPQRLAAAAARMRAAGKPVVALKVGRTERGAAASAAHTGSLARSHTAARAFFRDAGVVLVDDLDELIETCALIEGARVPPKGTGVAVINISGGEVALTCDLAEAAQVVLPPLASHTEELLSKALPDFATPANPLDATSSALAEPALYETSLRALLDDPGIALVAVSQDCPAGLSEAAAQGYGRLAAVAASVAREAVKPIVFYSNVAGALHPATVQPLRGSGVPVLHGARPALAGIRSYLDWHSWTPKPTRELPTPVAKPEWRNRLASGHALSEHESKRFLREHGIRTTREIVAHDVVSAVEAAQRIGFPVVAKVQSPDLPHKSEVGGVMLALDSADAVAEAFETILTNVARRAPLASVEGVVVQEMVVGGVEMIAGMATHAPFGPGVVVGAGGVLVELLQDSAFALAPVSADEVRAMVDSTRSRRLLEGFRGSPAADRAAFEEIVVRLADIALAYADVIDAIDLNPVAVLPRGKGACVLDALIVPRSSI